MYTQMSSRSTVPGSMEKTTAVIMARSSSLADPLAQPGGAARLQGAQAASDTVKKGAHAVPSTPQTRNAMVRAVPRHSRATLVVKRAIDVIGALVFFIAFGWLYLFIAVGVLVTSGRPVLFWQNRYGRNGDRFPFYKFRSMVPNAEQVLKEYLASNPAAAEEWAKFQKLDNDPRITPFGKFIRKTSLDELPQFWNVLRGDMSLIGPRPCLLEQKKLYGSYWGHYTSVRPGITGLWQVSGRNTVSYRRRIALDVRYVERLSIWQDIYIFLKTVWVVATGHGSK